MQVQELESALTQKGNESYIKELESNLHEQQGVNSHCRDEIKLLTERLNNEARRIKSLEREGDLLRSEISILESKVGITNLILVLLVILLAVRPGSMGLLNLRESA